MVVFVREVEGRPPVSKQNDGRFFGKTYAL